jgi:putative tryptophan/tyrosine transport system substrate-binding protein
MRRREFIAAVGGAAVWSVAARAQQPERLRRVGVLLPFDDERDPQVQDLLPAFKKRMQDLGWIDDRNIRLDIRFTGSAVESIRAGAEGLVATAPDVIFVWSNPAVQVLRQTTLTIPIVFALVGDPVGSGFVTNLARPAGNLTGFQNFEPEMGGKWLELLKEIAPGLRRIAFFYNQSIAANVGLLHSAQAASGSLGEDLVAIPQREVADIEPALAAFAQGPNNGLIVAPTPFGTANRELIIALAARLRLPAIYPFRLDPLKGGLMSYGFDTIEQQRGAAGYVDRILRGAKPQDLPVQVPSKYQLVINLKTAKALELDVPVQLQQRADEVIE